MVDIKGTISSLGSDATKLEDGGGAAVVVLVLLGDPELNPFELLESPLLLELEDDLWSLGSFLSLL